MNRFLAFTLAVLISSPVVAEEIPLKSIWALDMPGTRDIRKLEPANPDPAAEAERTSLEEYVRSKLSMPVCQLLRQKGIERKVAPPGFVVPGIDAEALRAAHAVIVKKEKAQPVKAGQEASLVFFSCSTGGRIVFSGVEVVGDEVVLRFKFVRADDTEPGPQVALVPLGKFPAGKYRVTHKVQRRLQDMWVASSPFTFEITE